MMSLDYRVWISSPLPTLSLTHLQSHIAGLTLLDVARFTHRLCQWLNLGWNGHHVSSFFIYRSNPFGYPQQPAELSLF